MPKAHITVAAIIEHKGKFALVIDDTKAGHRLNQPAGHTEINETVMAAVIREVKEESSLDFTPEKIVGIYLFQPDNNNLYLRICFKGTVSNPDIKPRPCTDDDGVIDANWYSLEEIKQMQSVHRSELVMQCLNDYLDGKEYPLELIQHFLNNSGSIE